DTYAASFGDAANSNLKITGTAGGATGYGLIQTFTGGTTTGGTLSLQRSGGNVGIGLTAPTGRLEIANGTTAELQFSGANVANIYQSTSAQALYVNSNTGPLYLGANGSGSTHLTVLSNGNVGINNTAPAQKLEVAGGNIRAHGGNVQCGPTDASVLSALTYTTGMGVVGSFTNSPFAIYTNSAEKLRVDATGNVGIGVSAPTSKLHVAGAGLFTGQVQATSFFQSSLRSLKKDIQPFTASALDIFKKVQVRTFKFKADTSGKTNIGFIADEVPNEMATPQRNGVDQASTVALLVKAVQELTEQNKVLQEKISKLEAKMNEK
ncbi:MAG TPA: tail fiber domain-containing protein, partial [Chitinophaga sp.]